jgi:hypothetical protein
VKGERIMMKQVSIDEARKAHENGHAVLLLGDTWDKNDEISVEIGGELVLPTDDFYRTPYWL